MKTHKIVLLLIFMSCLLSATAMQAKAWPIFCKGPLQVTITKQLAAGILSAGDASIRIGFRNPGVKDGPQMEGLQAGECSWPDRALNQNETNCLNLVLSGTDINSLAIEYQVLAGGELKASLAGYAGSLASRLSGLKETNRQITISVDGFKSCGIVKSSLDIKSVP
ncbi:MAG: hypothetical protein KDK39_06760 [Leptospiraceae bacterium]|nr:hypothetical protein [Leptospiraceae bacterium]